MQLKHIALATLMALSLAACGGGDDAPTTQPNNPPTDNDKKPTDDGNTSGNKIVDPTEAEVVSEFQLDKKPSSGSSFYRREDQSKFDRYLNPDKKQSSQIIFGVTLDDQNPDLTNFQVQQYGTPGKPDFMYQLIGAKEELPTLNQADDTGNENKSLPYNNAKNIIVYTDTDYTMGSTPGANLADVSTDLQTIEDHLKNQIPTLRTVAYIPTTTTTAQKAAWLAKVDAYEAKLTAYKNVLKQADDFNKAYEGAVLPGHVIEGNATVGSITSGVTGLTTSPFANATSPWGDGLATTPATTDQDSTTALNEAVSGLVGVGYNTTPGQIIQGTDDKTRQNTRIFGKSYRNIESENNEESAGNSWLEALPIGMINITDDDDHATLAAAVAETKQADNGASGSGANTHAGWDGTNSIVLDTVFPRFDVAAVPMTLKDVQYGRISAQADPLLKSQVVEDQKAYYLDYADHNKGGKYEDSAANFYFARGTNATTLEQMAALPTDKTISYQGHALMFGLDNRFHGGSSGVPSSSGVTSGQALGNFVYAELNTGEKKVNGGVYNTWIRQIRGSGEAIVDKDILVEFTGNVTGNTAVGSAWRTYIAGKGETADPSKDPASFRASFFGKNANEMGGTISAVTYNEVFGNGGENGLWGGAFGAKRVDKVVDDVLPGKWFGDTKKPVAR